MFGSFNMNKINIYEQFVINYQKQIDLIEERIKLINEMKKHTEETIKLIESFVNKYEK